MVALGAAIHVLQVAFQQRKTWMAGTSPAMTPEGRAFAATAPHRHGRDRRGHPRLACGASAKEGVDGRNKSGHDSCPPYSALIFAALMIGHHFSISALW